MTKLIGILILVLVIWGGYEVFELWDKYDKDQDLKTKAEEDARNFSPQQLPGMPGQLEDSYSKAEKNGALGIRNWLKAYGSQIQDPRKAWIELDYMVLIAHDDPVEAKKIFADVKGRTPTDSKIYPRIQQLAKTYD